MPAALIPDIEKLVAIHLRGELDTRVVIDTPNDRATSWIRITQVDGTQRDPADHLVEFAVQLDCYAGDVDPHQQIGQAINLGLEARQALQGMIGTHDQGVVSGVQVYNHLRIPDRDFTPARQRVVISATVWAHS